MKKEQLNIMFVDNLPEGKTFEDLENTVQLDPQFDWEELNFSADYFDSDDFYDFVDEYYDVPTWATDVDSRVYAEQLEKNKKK